MSGRDAEGSGEFQEGRDFGSFLAALPGLGECQTQRRRSVNTPK